MVVNIIQLDSSWQSRLKHKGKTIEEQIQNNQPTIALLQKWLTEEVSEEISHEQDNYWEKVKEIIDQERPSGCKLYRGI